jgi:hypothetical protein
MSDVDVWIVVERILNDQGSNNVTRVRHPNNLSKLFSGFNLQTPCLQVWLRIAFKLVYPQQRKTYRLH